MAKKGTSRAGRPRAPEPEERPAVSGERSRRLHRLVQILGRGAQTRDVLIRRLRLDVRGFYRDLELLRSSGIRVTLEGRRYTLEQDTAEAVALLPFPDPRLTLGEAVQLAKGRSSAHRKLQALIDEAVK